MAGELKGRNSLASGSAHSSTTGSAPAFGGTGAPAEATVRLGAAGNPHSPSVGGRSPTAMVNTKAIATAADAATIGSRNDPRRRAEETGACPSILRQIRVAASFHVGLVALQQTVRQRLVAAQTGAAVGAIGDVGFDPIGASPAEARGQGSLTGRGRQDTCRLLGSRIFAKR